MARGPIRVPRVEVACPPIEVALSSAIYSMAPLPEHFLAYVH
jgi:hypothetical protein